MWLSVSYWSLWEISSTAGATKWRLTPSMSASPSCAASAGSRGWGRRAGLKSTGLDRGALTAEWAQWIINHGISERLWSPACHIMFCQIIFERVCFFYQYVTFWSSGCCCHDCQAFAPVTSNMEFSIISASHTPRGNHSKFLDFLPQVCVSVGVSLCSYEIIWWLCPGCNPCPRHLG